MSARRLALGLSVMLSVAGCGGSGPTPGARPAVPGAQLVPPTAATLPAPAPAAAPAVLPKDPEPGPPLAPKSYEVKGRRDPFVPIALPKPKDTKGGIDVSIFRLVGVIQGPTLLALVEGPDGVGYILKPGDMLGDARLTEVTLTSVVFTVDPLGGQRPGTITLRLRTD